MKTGDQSWTFMKVVTKRRGTVKCGELLDCHPNLPSHKETIVHEVSLLFPAAEFLASRALLQTVTLNFEIQHCLL
jgi:hypothetical protein